MSNANYQIFAYYNVTGSNETTHNRVLTFNGSFTTLKHFDFGGDGVNHSGGAAMQPAANTVIYDGIGHDFGEYNAVAENDYHFIKPVSSTASHDIWILEVGGYHLGGDTVQIGTANNTPDTGPFNIYIGGGTSYQNGENAVDIKTSQDVIISKVIGREMSQISTGGNAVISVHNAARRCWMLFNECYSTGDGIAISQDAGNPADLYVIGNILHDCTDSGVQVRATVSPWTHIINNTFHNNSMDIELHNSGPQQATIRNNLFSTLSGTGTGDGHNISGLATGCIDNSTIDFNFYVDINNNRGGTTAETMAEWQGAPFSKDANGSEGTADFTNTAARDFSLLATSDAINVGDEDAAYATFEALYGLDIRVDFAGNARPAVSGDWDCGAHERV